MDTIIKEIPIFFQTKIWKEYFTKKQAFLDIEPIENGVIGWQIRLWISHGYSKNDTAQLIIFQHDNNQISGQLINHIESEEAAQDNLFPFKSKPIAIVPKSGWRHFIESIESLGIYKLPDYKELEGYYLASDSYGVIVEVATKNKYRIFSYPDYEGYINEIDEANKFFQIMRLIENEFEIKVIY